MLKKMKKLTIEEAAKKVIDDRSVVVAEVQSLSGMKSAMGEKHVPEVPEVIDNHALLEKVLKIHGAMISGSNLELKDETDGLIYEALKDIKAKAKKVVAEKPVKKVIKKAK